MDITNLIPTHNTLRNMDTLKFFIEKVQEDYGFGIIRLVETEDGKLYIWDGHHKLVAHYLCGKDDLPDYMFDIQQRTYASVQSINFESEFVTPFDLRGECRKPEFFIFKNSVLEEYYNMSYEVALLHIVSELNLINSAYKELRDVSSLKDLASKYEFQGIS